MADIQGWHTWDYTDPKIKFYLGYKETARTSSEVTYNVTVKAAFTRNKYDYFGFPLKYNVVINGKSASGSIKGGESWAATSGKEYSTSFNMTVPANGQGGTLGAKFTVTQIGDHNHSQTWDGTTSVSGAAPPPPPPPPPPPEPEPNIPVTEMDVDGESHNPLVPWYKPTAVPPAYHDDNLPTHRIQQGDYFLRLGDCQFFIPPLFIRVNNSTPTRRLPSLRQRESKHVNSGYSNREIQISLWFNDLEQINGIPIKGGPDGETYYMDGLRSLISQFKKTPFVPVVNELLNSVHGIYAVTLLTVSAQTVPELPGCMQVQLTLKEFNAQPYIGIPTPALDMMYCWPLFRWFYQQPLLDSGSISKYKLPKITTSDLTGIIRFRLLPEYLLTILKPNVKATDNKYKQYGYIEDEWAFMEEVPMDYGAFTVNNIAISVGNIVTDLQLANYATPTHQYLGSLDTMISLDITTESRLVAADFVKLQETVQEYSRKYQGKIQTGYIGVENELINMYGVDTVTIQNLDISTVEGHPDLLSIRLDLLSYNKTQKEQEKPHGMAPSTVLDESELMIGKDVKDYKNPIIIDGVIEDMINELELYPDLELPTYTKLREVIDKLNTVRKANGQLDLGLKGEQYQCPYKRITETVKEPGRTETTRRPIIVFPGKTFKRGVTKNDSDLKLAQERLKEKGYLPSNYNCVGTYDEATSKAVVQIRTDRRMKIVDNLEIEAWNEIVNFNPDPRVSYPPNNEFIICHKKYGFGNHGPSTHIKTFQGGLKELGFYSGSLDGVVNDATDAAIIAFQKSTGFLKPDGLAGYNVWGELFTRILQKNIPPVIEKTTTDDSYFVDPDFYIFYPSPIALGLIDTNTFDSSLDVIRAGASSGMLDTSILKGGNGAAQAHNMMKILNNAKAFRKDYGVKAKLATDPKTQDMPNIADHEYYKLMVHDAFAHSRRYTMMRAFPTALFIFVDEGQRVRGIRMWSNFYSYHSLVSISVTKHRDNPADICEVVVSNVYHNLSTDISYNKAEKKSFWDTWFLTVDKKMIEERKKLHDFMALKAGCRIHVRMGYGSAPQGLPIVFNGTIANIDYGDIMTIIAQGDGAELTNPIPDLSTKTNNGVFKLGAEPSDILKTLLSARDGFQAAFTWKNTSGKFAGFSNGSRFGIEHFGYVFAKDGILEQFKALFHLGDQGRWTYDVAKNIYKGPPFVADNGKHRRTTKGGNKGKDEENVYMFLYGKSTWDISKHLAMASPEYIAYPATHGFRSTFFFGQPTWLYKYGFRYTGFKKVEDRRNIDHYYELVKTFQQLHFVDSTMDIIDNGTQANSLGVTTAVIPVYTEDNKTKNDLLLYADRNIYPEYQRTEYYDTTSMQDFPFLDFAMIAAPGDGWEFAKRKAVTMGISYLQHSFRDMYKGEIIILGDAAIKPYDFIFLTDAFRGMFGPCEAGGVTTEMSLETGFITSIKPDMITVTQSQLSVPVTRTLAAAQLFAYNIYTARSTIVSASTAEKTIIEFTKRNKDIQDWEKRGDLIQLMSSGAVAAGFLLLGPAGIPAVLATMFAWALIDKAIEWMMNVFSGRYDHTISAIPLMYKNRPLIAGLKGHQTLIPGYYDQDVGDEPYLVQDESMTDEAMKSLIENHEHDWNNIIKGHNARASSGVDIFKLKPNQKMTWDLLASNVGGRGSGGGSATDIRNKILAEAKRIIDAKWPYVWGGESEAEGGYDCSGYVWHCYNVAGVPMSKERGTADTQYQACKEHGEIWTEQSKCKPGDLIFWMYPSRGKFHHVGLWVAKDTTYEAMSTASGIKSSSQIDGRKQTDPSESNYGEVAKVYYGRTKELVNADRSAGGGGTIPNLIGMSKDQMIQAIAGYAMVKYKATGLWASLIIANAGQESSWGQSSVAKGGKNLFGIKAYSDWKGKTYGKAPSSEDGASYRAYDTYEESIDDFVQLIMTADRYKPIRFAKDPIDACRFYETGYAGDSGKDNKLKSIIRTNNLTQYDKK